MMDIGLGYSCGRCSGGGITQKQFMAVRPNTISFLTPLLRTFFTGVLIFGATEVVVMLTETLLVEVELASDTAELELTPGVDDSELTPVDAGTLGLEVVRDTVAAVAEVEEG